MRSYSSQVGNGPRDNYNAQNLRVNDKDLLGHTLLYDLFDSGNLDHLRLHHLFLCLKRLLGQSQHVWMACLYGFVSIPRSHLYRWVNLHLNILLLFWKTNL